MATALQNLIDAYIKRNANQEITGPVLNGVLTAIANALGTPFVGSDGYWYTYDADSGQFVKTDTPAQGETGPVGVTEAAATIDDQIGTPEVDVDLNGTQLVFSFKNLKGRKGDTGDAGITAAVVTVDSGIGTPSVDASITGTTLTLAFHNLKGETGAAAGFGTIEATVDDTTGTPAVVVTESGPDTAKNLSFAFSGLKGEKGDQGDTGVSADYPITIANNLTTDDPTAALAASQGVVLKGEIDQLGQKVDDISTGKYYGYYATAADLPETGVDGFAYVGSGPTYTIYNRSNGVWASSGVTVNQSPIGNEEDIDQNASGKLQFADRTYNAQQPNGMGYVILRKNKTFASQVTDTNTIYEIRYPFDLGGDEVTIPSGCVLKFNGGMLSNGTLSGTSTKIDAGSVSIFSGITIAGTWIVPDIYSEWFADITQTNKVFNLFSLCNNVLHNTVTISGDCNVAIDTTATPSKYTNGQVILLDGQKDIDIILNGSLQLAGNSYIGYRIISLSNCSSVTIKGSGSIVGDRDSHDYTTTTAEGSGTVSTHEFGHGIYIFNNSRDITVRGVKVHQCTGDGIGVLCNDVRIEGVELYDNRRQGISVANPSERVIIEDFNIHDIDGTAPMAAIDIEPNGSAIVRNIIVRNGQVSNCTHAVCVAGPASAKTIRNIEVSNIYVKDFSTTDAVFYVQGGTNVRFSGIRFENIAPADATVNRTRVLFQAYYSDRIEIRDIKAIDSISMPSFISGREASVKMENCLFNNASVTGGQFLYMDADDFDFDLINSNISSAKFIFYNPKIPSFRIVGCTLDMNFNLQSWNGSTVEKSGLVECCTFHSSAACYYANTIFRRNTITANYQLYGKNVILEDNAFNTNCTFAFSNSINCSFVRNRLIFTTVSSYCVSITGTNKNILVKSNFIDISGVSSRIQSVFYTRGEQIEISNNLLVIGDRLTNFLIIPSTSVALSFKNNSVDGTPAVKYFSTDGGVFPIYREYEYTLNVGATANRPTLTSAEPEVGFLYFDTTLGKPVWWDGSAWKDATGAAV